MPDNKNTQQIVIKYCDSLGGYRPLAEELSSENTGIPGIAFSFQAVGKWALGSTAPDYAAMLAIYMLAGDGTAKDFAREVLAVQYPEVLEMAVCCG